MSDWRQHLGAFLTESNAIEGINGFTKAEFKEAETFLELESVHILDLWKYVSTTAGIKHRLRNIPGLNVQVGSHVAPPGGPLILDVLQGILQRAKDHVHPFDVHRDYETLHPFTDGNGRSGRLLWAWQMVNQNHGYNVGLQRRFLHEFYYQTLERSRA